MATKINPFPHQLTQQAARNVEEVNRRNESLEAENSEENEEHDFGQGNNEYNECPTIHPPDIVAVHASDASSPAIRAAAVGADAILLGEGRTHTILRPLLPWINNLILDRSDKVRLVVANMLLLVKKTRGMKYYHVVLANHLLARLADEGRGRNDPSGPVACTLSDLLENSLFPTGSNMTMTDIVNCTMRLLTDSPRAAAFSTATRLRCCRSIRSRG